MFSLTLICILYFLVDLNKHVPEHREEVSVIYVTWKPISACMKINGCFAKIAIL
jgi:hypothetical protein